MGSVERAAASEDGEASEQQLLRRVKQVVAPFDRPLQRPLSFGQVARASRQQRQTLFEAGQHLSGFQEPNTARRQLDGERQPVEPSADFSYRRSVLVGEAESWFRRASTLDKEGDRLDLRHPIRIDRSTWLGRTQRRDRELLLTIQV